ncbi:uncharacterized protein [Prorops nasuta]|uniref:uncharacterized protein isoform X2 n=1 Tax=Prorops nasuta TaxID=863751 RepID=UPI0034CD49A1
MTSMASNDSVEAHVEHTQHNRSHVDLWNAESTMESIPENMSIPFNITKSTTIVYTSTTLDPFNEFGPPDGVEYIFVPLGVMVFVIVLSAVVLIISRKRKLERLRHRLMPMYNFDPGEEEDDDWETELLDETYSTYQRRQGYQSMGSDENAELFGDH